MFGSETLPGFPRAALLVPGNWPGPAPSAPPPTPTSARRAQPAAAARVPATPKHLGTTPSLRALEVA